MAKITPKTVSSGYNLNTINENFQALATELQNKVLYRNNPTGEPNQLEQQLDMNSNRVINLLDAVSPSEPATLRQLQALASGAPSIGVGKVLVIATAGQTVFSTATYVPGGNNLNIYINGVRQSASSYTETSTTSVTFSEGLGAGDEVEFIINEQSALAGTVSSSAVTYSGGNATAVLDRVIRYFPTFASAVADVTVGIGDRVTIGERANGEFEIVAPGGENGFDIVTGDAARSLQLITEKTLSTDSIGALGDWNGATGVDDTLPLQQALNLSGLWVNPPTDTTQHGGGTHNRKQGKVVLGRSKRYKITDTLQVPPGVEFDLNGSTIDQTVAAKDAVAVSYSLMSGGGYGAMYNKIHDGTIQGVGAGSSTGRGLFLEVNNFAQIDNLNIDGFKFGLTCWELQYSRFNGVRCQNNKVGAYITAQPTQLTLASIDNRFDNCTFSANEIGLWLQCSTHSLFTRIDTGRNSVVDILIGSQLIGYITSYTVTNGGTGYGASTTVPVTITGGGGTQAQAYGITNGSGVVTSVVGVDGGVGYTTTPTVTIGGSGTGATATATTRDDTGLGDWDGVSVITRGRNIFIEPKIEHNTDDIPSSGYAVIVQNIESSQNVFDLPMMNRQVSGSGPTAYMRMIRSGGRATTVIHPIDTQNSFSAIANPAVSGDVSVFRSIVAQGLNVQWGWFNDSDKISKYTIDETGAISQIDRVSYIGFNANGYPSGVGFKSETGSDGAVSFSGKVIDDAFERFKIEAGGIYKWGSGTGATDVQLSRPAANILALAGGDGFGSGNTSANTNTPSGATARHLPWHDEFGNLLGYIPIYTSPW